MCEIQRELPLLAQAAIQCCSFALVKYVCQWSIVCRIPKVAVIIIESGVFESDIRDDINFGVLCYVLEGRVERAYDYLIRVYGDLLSSSGSLDKFAHYCRINE